MADLRRCIGSATFGIEAHEAPVGDFPIQPSQKDGLGRMCKPHWNQYTTALRKAALARKAADGGTASAVTPSESEPATVPARKGVGGRKPTAATPEPIRTRPARPRKAHDETIVEAVDPGEGASAEGATIA